MPSTEQMIRRMGEAFCGKITAKYSLVAQIDLRDARNTWHRWCVIVRPSGKVMIRRGSVKKPEFVFVTTSHIIGRIYQGEMTGMTAMAQGRTSERPPLGLKLGKGVRFSSHIKAKLFDFVQHFFNRSFPEKTPLATKHARLVHGAYAIPLYYHSGLRSAWYLVKKGQRLNEPGETNSFHQAFTFVSGEGFARIGDRTVRVKEGESYYVPPNSDHVVWNKSGRPLALIYFAWGRGA